MINNRLAPPRIYALSTDVGLRRTWEEAPRYCLELFARQGMRLFQVDVWLDQMWTAPDRFDIDLARRQIRGLLDVCPDAAVMFRLHVNSPPWWNDLHPDQCVRFADVEVKHLYINPVLSQLIEDLNPRPRHSIASKQWLDQCGEKLAEFCRLLGETPEGNAVFGIQVAAGVFGEWHYYAFVKHEPDTSPAMTARFRSWLRERYGDDRALQTAWNDLNATLAAATVPNVEERFSASAGYLRDPQKERKAIDYFRCQHESVTDAFIHFCGIVKNNWPRPIIAGGFHGYWFKMFGRMAAGGHLEVERALESPMVDFLAAPQTYGHLAPGQSGLARGLVESCRLHGKIFLDEMDVLPAVWRVKSRGQRDGADERLAESIAVLRRNVMQSFCRGGGMWYYELPSVHPHHATDTAISMWDHPEILTEIAKMHALQSKYLNRKYESPADVLLVFDTESFYYSGHKKDIDPISTELLDGVTEELLHAGAAVDMIYLFDLDRVDLDRYRAVIFANLHKLDGEQRELIASKVARNGRHLVWQCAPGYTDGQKLTPENVSSVTGISLAPTRTTKARVSIDSPEIAKVELGNGKVVEPLFVVNDASAIALGRLVESEQTAFARKSFGSHTVWYSNVPMKSRAILRHILTEAGVHIYSDRYDVVYAGSDLLLIHTADADARTITLRNGKTIKLQQSHPSTVLIDINTGDQLFQ